MKIALGMIVRNERQILNFTLNYKALYFPHRIAIDFMSDDYSVELLGSYGFSIRREAWRNDFSYARNQLIKYAEALKMDYIFMLDADEALMQSDMEKLLAHANQNKPLRVPRIEFVKDFNHIDSTVAPDWQCRYFPLNAGYHFAGEIHEMLKDKDGHPAIEKAIKVNTPIYHYSRCINLYRVALKYVNYDRIKKGEAPLASLPDSFDYEKMKLWKEEKPVDFPHPLQFTDKNTLWQK